MEFKEPLTGGIIIVGSLFWDLHETRKDLRENYLKIQSTANVPVPIRYGRRSEKRGTITMVVSPTCKPHDKIGIGKLVPFSHAMIDSTSLTKAVGAIITAEMKKGVRNSMFYWDWGCLALLLNPAAMDKESTDKLTRFWASKFESGFQPNSYILEGESELLAQNGCLNLEWQEEYGGLDFLVLTATQPNIPAPSIAQLVEYFKQDDDYFRNNIIHGIHTYQDAKILEILNASHEKES